MPTNDVVWVEPLVENDIGATGWATLLDDGLGAYVDVRMVDGEFFGLELSVPRAGVLAVPE